MKNITATVDDNIYRRARIRAAELEQKLRAEIGGISVSDRLSRDALYDCSA